jgi:hypothetical protein
MQNDNNNEQKLYPNLSVSNIVSKAMSVGDLISNILKVPAALGNIAAKMATAFNPPMQLNGTLRAEFYLHANHANTKMILIMDALEIEYAQKLFAGYSARVSETCVAEDMERLGKAIQIAQKKIASYIDENVMPRLVVETLNSDSNATFGGYCNAIPTSVEHCFGSEASKWRDLAIEGYQMQKVVMAETDPMLYYGHDGMLKSIARDHLTAACQTLTRLFPSKLVAINDLVCVPNLTPWILDEESGFENLVREDKINLSQILTLKTGMLLTHYNDLYRVQVVVSVVKELFHVNKKMMVGISNDAQHEHFSANMFEDRPVSPVRRLITTTDDDNRLRLEIATSPTMSKTVNLEPVRRDSLNEYYTCKFDLQYLVDEANTIVEFTGTGAKNLRITGIQYICIPLRSSIKPGQIRHIKENGDLSYPGRDKNQLTMGDLYATNSMAGDPNYSPHAIVPKIAGSGITALNDAISIMRAWGMAQSQKLNGRATDITQNKYHKLGLFENRDLAEVCDTSIICDDRRAFKLGGNSQHLFENLYKDICFTRNFCCATASGRAAYSLVTGVATTDVSYR